MKTRKYVEDNKYNLRWAKLRQAYLSGADLRGADLRWADLHEADLSEADLRGAKLHGANLHEADLSEADLRGADLSETCLDPMQPPNGDVKGFELIDGGNWAVGYRTCDSPHLGGPGYQIGESYVVPVFSTSGTECHPGLFVCPSVEAAQKWGSDIIKVIFRPWDCHKAGEKHRVREFIVWEKVRA